MGYAITIQTDKKEYKEGETVKVTGHLLEDGKGTSSEIRLVKNDEWAKTTTSQSNGFYSFEDAAKPPGRITYSVNAPIKPGVEARSEETAINVKPKALGIF